MAANPASLAVLQAATAMIAQAAAVTAQQQRPQQQPHPQQQQQFNIGDALGVGGPSLGMPSMQSMQLARL
eukprot:15466306-Alexandrium_andersonii.AAC.1